MKMIGIRHRSGLERCLQFETGHTWHANIGNQARGVVPDVGVQELLCGNRSSALTAPPIRLNPGSALLNRLVVVDDRQKIFERRPVPIAKGERRPLSFAIEPES